MSVVQNQMLACAHYSNLGFAGSDFLTDIEPHRHDFYEISVTVENGYSSVINGKKTKMQVGDVYFVRPSDWHELIVNADNEKHLCVNIMVPPENFRDVCLWLSPNLLRDITESPEVPCFRLTASALHDLCKRIEYPLFAIRESEVNPEMLGQIKPIEKAIIAELLGQYLFYQGQDIRNMSECVRKLVRLLETDERAIFLRVSQIAGMLNYSQAYLCRQFSKYFNITLERYLIERRIEKSAFMLLSRDITVDRIARATGWKKTGNYITEFKRVYGETPSRYRNMVMESQPAERRPHRENKNDAKGDSEDE